MTCSLLVVAGEASGDRAAASVLAHLRGLRGMHVFGMGGEALASEHVELISDLRASTALGIAEVGARAWNVGLAYARLRLACKKRRPNVALLVNYTEFNAHLAKALREMDTRVLWYGAPQIWAWRRGRAIALRQRIDRMAVMLPFEEPLWRAAGVDAHYVGHPALEETRRPAIFSQSAMDEMRKAARERLGLTERASAIAILPGSRPHEVRRLLEPMLAGYETVRRDRASVDARVLLAPSLDDKTRAFAHAVATGYRTEVTPVDARRGMADALPAFDAALTASGTASLECALAGAVPIVCYRVGWVTELGARMLMTTRFVALPNILLDRPAFPELLQREANATRIAEALARVLDDREAFTAKCDDVAKALHGERTASQHVARMLEEWLTGTKGHTNA
ncbi:MAG: lipid-A-disaccharide synthase [Polyangiaceae bacterium]|nr:lipid-A-disaccharide synthase [Polyangiaceae bacterium]